MQLKHPSQKRRRLSLKPAVECLTLGALVERARVLDALDVRLRRLLPAAVARECRLANIQPGRGLVFLATSSAWATRLRLHQAVLLAEARTALGNAVERFTVKVAPLPSVTLEPVRHTPLSDTAAEHLRIAAKSMADPELQALYLQLASLAKIKPK